MKDRKLMEQKQAFKKFACQGKFRGLVYSCSDPAGNVEESKLEEIQLNPNSLSIKFTLAFYKNKLGSGEVA